MTKSNNVISFLYLFDLLRSEKSSNGLTKLKYDLFDDISNYLNMKKEILNETTDSDGKAQILEELKSIIQVVKELYEVRLSKVIDLAKNTLTFDDFENENIDNLSKFEQKYYESIIRIFGDQKKWLYDHFDFYNKELGVEAEEIKEAVKTEDNQVKTEEVEIILVRFQKDTPKFMGTDLKFKGPYKKGDEVEFDIKQANFLLKKNLVEKIN